MGLTMRVRALLMRLEDFRLLPLFVALSMAAGVAIGSVLSISDFALTPPIDALKAIAAGTFDLTVPNAISLGVPIGLFAMMYPAMTNVRLGEVGNALRSPRQLAVVLVFNYLVAPFLMLGLANVFVSDPELHTGLVLYGLAPCIAMVIIFTFLAKGNTPMALGFVALTAAVRVAFASTGRDCEIAIAIAITAFSPTVALATVVGPLVEVPVMLALVWAAMRLGRRLFRPATVARAAVGA